jgi:ATP-dependent Lon protease
MELLELERKINIRVRKQMEKTAKRVLSANKMKAIQKNWRKRRTAAESG